MPAASGSWRGAATAAKFLGFSRGAVERLAARSLISKRCLPGEPARYYWPDIERVVAESTRGATTTVAEFKAER